MTRQNIFEFNGAVSAKTVLDEVERLKKEGWKLTIVSVKIPLMNSAIGERQFYWRLIIRFLKEGKCALIKVHDINIGGGNRSKTLYEILTSLGIECDVNTITTEQFRKEYAMSIDCDETTSYVEVIQLIWVAGREGMHRMK